MNVLAISGRHRDAAAAIAVDGRIVAATAEESLVRVPRIGYRQTGGFPWAAVRACLDRSGLEPGEISTVAIVGPPGREGSRGAQPLPLRPRDKAERGLAAGLADSTATRVPVLHAHAAQLAATSEAQPSVLLIVEPVVAGASGAFLLRGGELTLIGEITGLDQLTCAARRVARALGSDARDPFAALETIGRWSGSDFSEAIARTIGWKAPFGISVDRLALERIVEAAAAEDDQLSWTESPNVFVQERRRALAEGFCRGVVQLVADLGRRLCEGYHADRVGVSGSLFAAARLNALAQSALATAMDIAPVPEPVGLALGAALAGSNCPRRSIVGLSLGPEYSEEDIKKALENCRLDYVYEPDWQRLLHRISSLLQRGKTVGWFQGASDFGPRPLGGRCVVCDPSTRYARENLTVYLRHGSTEPLAVTMSQSAADECLSSPVPSPFMLMRAGVKQEFRDALRAAVDDGAVTVHTLSHSTAPPLSDLLAVHRARTGVPGLINLPLAGPHEPIACSPRDAVRTTYSSAIDALVAGRFLLMKDHWLLRSDVVS